MIEDGILLLSNKRGEREKCLSGCHFFVPFGMWLLLQGQMTLWDDLNVILPKVCSFGIWNSERVTPCTDINYRTSCGERLVAEPIKSQRDDPFRSGGGKRVPKDDI